MIDCSIDLHVRYKTDITTISSLIELSMYLSKYSQKGLHSIKQSCKKLFQSVGRLILYQELM